MCLATIKTLEVSFTVTSAVACRLASVVWHINGAPYPQEPSSVPVVGLWYLIIFIFLVSSFYEHGMLFSLVFLVLIYRDPHLFTSNQWEQKEGG